MTDKPKPKPTDQSLSEKAKDDDLIQRTVARKPPGLSTGPYFQSAGIRLPSKPPLNTGGAPVKR